MSKEWQLFGDDSWVFGEKIRGIVRRRVAEVWFDEDATSSHGGWHWAVYPEFPAYEQPCRGISASLSDAIVAAEEAMEIT